LFGRTIFRLVLVAALIGLGWLYLAPPQLGGRTTYVIADGTSMLPHYHAGDLVVLRKESSYTVGEVAAYHNHQLGVVVMHRIVAIKGGRYSFKGDNNNFVDSSQPTESQIVGTELVHVPGAGRLLLTLRDPAIAAGLLGLLWLTSFSAPQRSRRQRRRHRHAS